MRSQDEIQHAHDTLWSQVTGETPFVFHEASRQPMQAALEVLCWVLEHNDADGFRRSLADIEAGLAERGYRLCRRTTH